PENLLGLISNAMDRGASVAVLSTPDRELSNKPGHMGPPLNPAHVREWTRAEFGQFLEANGLRGYAGRTRTNDVIPALRTALAVVAGRSPRDRDVVASWFEERQRWQRTPEGQDRSFAKYEEWARGLQEYNEYLLTRQNSGRWSVIARSVVNKV